MTKTKTNKRTQKTKPDKPDKNKREPKDKSEKQSKAAQPSDVQAAAAKGKSSGKGDKKDDKSPKGKKVKEGDRKKLPCMYYAYNSCNKGNECPYLHDPNNLYKGGKPRGLAEKGTSSSAGAATVAVATVVASQVQPCSGQDVSRTHAPIRPRVGSLGSIHPSRKSSRELCNLQRVKPLPRGCLIKPNVHAGSF